ncbi:MAG: hypothetical protein QOJ23_5881 [Actinomycetota bacterium]|nr:hypothetical protein [Actinomycetota bacterium]MDQ1500895.1 hypothetical protein [Actinomycetota bacterium]
MNREGTMLLSRVARSVYWAGRHLERAEATARLVHVHTKLFLDLPKAAGIGWRPLLALAGNGEAFRQRHPEASEEHVVGFLATDADHQGSIVGSVAQAHSSLRVTQAILPSEAWEVLNQLHSWAAQTRHQAVDRRTRLGWTTQLIRQCQLLSGMLEGAMSHDDTYAFLEIGRSLERADMTTRVLDIQAGVLAGQRDGANPYVDVTWTGVLRSLSAYQMFLRTAGSTVTGPAALRFLLRDQQFPRSVERCLIVISYALLELCRHDDPMAGCAEVQRLLAEAELDGLGPTGLHDYADRLQQGLGALHDQLVATYFPMEPSTETALQSA